MNISFKQKVIEDLIGYDQVRKPAIGLEYERVTIFTNSLSHNTPITDKELTKIKNIILDFNQSHKDYVDYEEYGMWKGIQNTKTGYSITLEPGLQLEIVSGVYTDLQRCLQEMDALNTDIISYLNKHGIYLLEDAVNFTIPEQHSYILSGRRFDFLKNTFNFSKNHKNTGAIWLKRMMSLSASVQMNFNHFGANDMMRKLRAMMILQPLCMALFSNSPFIYQKNAKILSYRYFIWWNIKQHFTLTNIGQRVGVWSLLWNPNSTVEEYADYVINLNMWYLLRKNHWQSVPTDYTFNDLLNGKPIDGKVYTPTIQDWRLHNNSTFPDTRARSGYLELRFLDTNDWSLTQAIIILLFTIFYDNDLLDFILSWPREYGLQQDNYDETLFQAISRGLNSTMPNGLTMQQLATKLYAIVQTKLSHDNPLYSHLHKIDEIITSGCNPAQNKIKRMQGDWQQYMNSLSQSYFNA